MKNSSCFQRSHSLAAVTVFSQKGATERTTSMLLVVMLLFLLTEAPQGLLAGLSIVYGHDFFSDCYLQLADPMDLLALINSSINFLLYCVMSREFRKTFRNLYCFCSSRLQGSPSSLSSSKHNEGNAQIVTHF
ncbi:Serpentine type 7TM GPCR chemoreceptor Srw [Halocaridina rubra]|uniref:Serpentine type 7TM GPCR chemoreceptor Srw n=1 Tax=Halocaridina rubra TaxID=373956 RepID=A0AAN9A0M1_HALRR